MTHLILGIDGGGTGCRARLCTAASQVIGVGAAGPANIRFGLDGALAAVAEATSQSLAMAGLPPGDMGRIDACLALAGATEPTYLAAARQHAHPFRRVAITSDVRAALIGAHGGRDGGVVVAGTGSIGLAAIGDREVRVGGWGFPISDEGSGAWLGLEAMRRVLWALDGRADSTPLLDELAGRFGSNPHAIVRFMTDARPRDVAALAPAVVAHASLGDAPAVELMQGAASHVEELLRRLAAAGVERIALVGGLSASVAPWLPLTIRERLSAPLGDALDGALTLARSLSGGDAEQALLRKTAGEVVR